MQLSAPTTESSTLYFPSIDEILGPNTHRFFGQGFRRVSHQIRDIEIAHRDGRGRLTATGSIAYPGDWSVKATAGELRPHLSSIDALVLSVQLSELYISARYGLDDGHRRKMWLRGFTMRAGSAAETSLDDIKIEIDHVETKIAAESLCGNYSRLDARVGAILVSANIEHHVDELRFPRGTFMRAEELLGPAPSRYYGDGFKLPVQRLEHVFVDVEKLTARALVRVEGCTGERFPQGIGAHYWPSLSALDCMITIAQLAQGLLYKLDGLERGRTNNLWMREIVLEANTPYQACNTFVATTTIEKTRVFKKRTEVWRTAEMTGYYQGITVRFSVAHQLPSAAPAESGYEMLR
jgi:hypothetical protein